MQEGVLDVIPPSALSPHFLSYIRMFCTLFISESCSLRALFSFLFKWCIIGSDKYLFVCRDITVFAIACRFMGPPSRIKLGKPIKWCGGIKTPLFLEFRPLQLEFMFLGPKIGSVGRQNNNFNNFSRPIHCVSIWCNLLV